MEDIKEKTAYEMFEELGYRNATNEFYGVKEEYFTYGNEEEDFIIFYLESKMFGIFSEKQDNLRCKCASLDMQELQAINKKCKELGWI